MFRASSYEPGNRAARLLRWMLLSVHLENFQPGRPGYMHFKKKKAKWWNINLHRLRLLCGFVDCFNFTTTSAVEKHNSQKLCHFCHCCWDSEAILSKNVSYRSPGLNCSYGKKFHNQYRDLGRKVRDFDNRGSPASHLKKLIFLSEESSGDARSRKSSQLSRPG